MVYIGDKPAMTYVFEVVGQLNSGAPEVRVKARGKAISRAVDVAEIVRRHKIAPGPVVVQTVRIGTERLPNRDGKDSNVSSIEIVLTLPNAKPGVSPGAGATPSPSAAPSAEAPRPGPPPA